MDRQLHIILLEDNASDAELVTRELRQGGLDAIMHQADDQPTFLAALEQHVPDMVIADYAIPGFNGLTALQMAREKFPLVPGILLSGTIGEERAVEALRTGATDYVLKERLSRLVPVVQRALQEAAEVCDRQQAEEERDRLLKLLQEAHEELQLTHEELQATHEELQATNEELLVSGEVLRESEEMYRTVAELIPFGMWLSDAHGGNAYSSDSMLQMLGKTQMEISRDGWIDLVHPDDRERVLATWGSAFISRVAWTAEFRLLGHDGLDRWILTRGLPIIDRDGRFRGYGGLNIDITERKEAEQERESLLLEVQAKNSALEAAGEQLRESEQLYRSVGELIPFGMWISDADDHNVYISSSLLQMLGRTREELQQGDWYELIHPEDRQRVTESAAMAIAGREEYQDEYRLLAHDGNYRWVLSKGVPRFDSSGEFEGYVGLNLDITSRKEQEERIVALANTAQQQLVELEQAQQALAASEERYRSIGELMPYGIWTADASGDVTYCSKNFLDLLGMDFAEFQREGWAKILHPDDLGILDKWAQTHAAGAYWSAEFRVRTRSGAYNWILCRAIPTRDDAGHATGYVGVHIDIQELKQAQAALTESEERYRSIGELMPYGVWMADADDHLTYVSKNLLDLVGLEATPATQTAWLEYVHPEDVGKISEQFALAVAGGGYFSAEFRVRAKDGQWHWLLCRGIPTLDDQGQLTGAMGVNIDIQEQKQAQLEREELLNSVDRERLLLQAILQQFPGGVVVIEPPDGRIMIANQPVFELIDWQGDVGDLAEEVIERTSPLIEGVHVPAREWSIVRALRNGEVTEDKRIRIASQQGERMLSIYARPVRNQEGAIIAALFSFFDITERVRAEEELRQHRDHLEELVRRRTEDLAATNEELGQQIQERERLFQELLRHQESLRATAAELARVEQRERSFIATALHDSVGQTLAFMRMKLGMIKADCREEDREHLQELDEMIQKAIAEARSLTVELAPPVLVQMGLESALSWLSGQMQQKHGYQVHFNDDGRPKPITEDVKITLFQAVRELMTNAAKHARAENLWLSVMRTDDKLELVIADDGVGFDVQSVHPTERQTFGLFNVQERVMHLGGTMEIQSRPGQGSRFVILVPLGEG